MNIPRRHLLAIAASAAALLAAASPPAAAHPLLDDDGLRSGSVFVSSNAASGNEVLVYQRDGSGALVYAARFATGGLGSNAGLGSQGAVTLSQDGRHLFVVNAQSNTVSTFAVKRHELKLVSVVASGGLHPISVAEHDGLVYVLNDRGVGNVAGFRNQHGELQPLAGSVRGLSAATGTAPAQVGFSDDGDALVVTEKGVNRVVSWRVNNGGTLGPSIVTPSAGATPFGFAFNRRGRLVVSEAFGGAAQASALSSYRFDDNVPPRPIVVSASVPTTQTAACWVAIAPNGRHAYTSNTGSSSISLFRVRHDGALVLVQAVAGNTGTGSAPADSAVSPDGRRFYVRNGGTLTIAAFRVEAGGELEERGVVGGLPAFAVGLAAN